MTRKHAADVLDAIRAMLASREPPAQIERFLQRQWGIQPLAACDGSAHENAHVDNCPRCAPRWGWVGDRVAVK